MYQKLAPQAFADMPEDVRATWLFGFMPVNIGFDVFHTHFDNTYSSVLNKETNMTDFFQSGASIAKGGEIETNTVVGRGLSVYVNAALLRARFADTGLSVQNSPKHTEAYGVTYARRAMTANMFIKHNGAMFNDNGTVHEAIPIDAVTMTNLSFSYRLRRPTAISRDMNFRVNVSNLFDTHSIIGVTPASKASNLPSPNDSVTLLAARSVAFTVTFDLGRK
jgi:iron complex outermembrane receptor protein